MQLFLNLKWISYRKERLNIVYDKSFIMKKGAGSLHLSNIQYDKDIIIIISNTLMDVHKNDDTVYEVSY